VLQCVIAVVCTLVESGLAFRGCTVKFGLSHNRNLLGLTELTAKFDPFFVNHVKQVNLGTYLSETM
jgi:hypothetical protein